MITSHGTLEVPREVTMSNPCIICVAITGSLPRKENNPAVPITVEEQVESTQAAFEAGATIAHCHVRNDDQTPSSDPEKFARLMEGLKKHCPGMIIQLSTGGRSGAGRSEERRVGKECSSRGGAHRRKEHEARRRGV